MFRMISILCIVGGVWLGGAALFVIALAFAARKPVPVGERAAIDLQQAA